MYKVYDKPNDRPISRMGNGNELERAGVTTGFFMFKNKIRIHGCIRKELTKNYDPPTSNIRKESQSSQRMTLLKLGLNR
jgi:hypothetical protein